MLSERPELPELPDHPVFPELPVLPELPEFPVDITMKRVSEKIRCTNYC